MIQVHIKVHPFCNHPKLTPDCKYCDDAKLVYYKLIRMQEETKHNLTKLSVLRADDGNKEAS